MSTGWKRLWRPPRRGRLSVEIIDDVYTEHETTKSAYYASRSKARFDRRTDEQNEQDGLFYGNIVANEFGRIENVRFIET